MKTRLLLSLLAVLSLSAMAQTIPPANQIVIGQIDSLQSKILKEKRTIWVHIPRSFQTIPFSQQRYPVVYLLDGDGHFSSVVGMIEQLSEVNGNMICPEMIVVGILNTNRTRDLSPSPGAGLIPSPTDSVRLKTSGGGENFTAFIEKELMPHIDSLYPTQPYRVLIGHSLGGLMVINTLIHHPTLFNAYVAIDPSMWWSKRKLLNEARTALPTQRYAGKSLFVGIANTMRPSQMDTLQVQQDTVAARDHIRAILDLHHLAKANPQNGLRYKGSYYPKDSHGSVPLIAEYDALHFLFDKYNLEVEELNFTDDDTLLAQKFANHFAAVSKSWGFIVPPPEETINSLAYFTNSLKLPKKAESLFRLNLANYPKSPNAHSSMGDYYAARKDTANAITQFQQSLALKESPETRKKLTELQTKKSPTAVADKPKK